ncbi:hypothetical protein BC628DRAFT_1402169 [Trametes gibbosa]|nr:hypothetical protein BC628DRAFT_1402169 [Trametes gibbosa]
MDGVPALAEENRSPRVLPSAPRPIRAENIGTVSPACHAHKHEIVRVGSTPHRHGLGRWRHTPVSMANTRA